MKRQRILRLGTEDRVTGDEPENAVGTAKGLPREIFAGRYFIREDLCGHRDTGKDKTMLILIAYS